VDRAQASLILAHAYDAIVDRLPLLQPTLEVLEIRVIVEAVAQRFERARLQQFVPLLVEKIARDECRRLSGPAAYQQQHRSGPDASARPAALRQSSSASGATNCD
jgi:hypothetical protein